MITLNLNLTQLEHGLVNGKTEGEILLVIPIKKNNLVLTEKKNVFLNIVGFEYEDKSDKEYKDTHLLKQSFNKEERERLGAEFLKSLPIIGNARVSGSTSHGEPEPKSASKDVASAVDDLPF